MAGKVTQQHGSVSGPALTVTVAFLLEGIPGGNADWRYRVHLTEGPTTAWIDVEGAGAPLSSDEVERLVRERAASLPSGHRAARLAATSPVVVDPA